MSMRNRGANRISLDLCDRLETSCIIPRLLFYVITLFTICKFAVNLSIGIIVIALLYVADLLILLLCFLFSYLISQKSKNTITLHGEYFDFEQNCESKTYQYREIVHCEYYVGKWYAIPVPELKNGKIHMLQIRTKNGDALKCFVVYSDYLKIKNKIKDYVCISER